MADGCSSPMEPSKHAPHTPFTRTQADLSRLFSLTTQAGRESVSCLKRFASKSRIQNTPCATGDSLAHTGGLRALGDFQPLSPSLTTNRAKSFARSRLLPFLIVHESESFPVFDRCVNRTNSDQPARDRTAAADSKKTSFGRIPRRDCGRSVSMAGKRRGPRGESVVGRAESADSSLSRQVAGPCCNREAIDGLVR